MDDNSQLLECCSDAEWDQFILSSPQCNPFSMSVFINALCIDYCRYFFRMDDNIVASILILKPDDPSFKSPHNYTLYQGLAFSNLQSKGPSQVSLKLKIIQSLLHHLNLVHPSHSLCLHPSVTDLRAFQWYNYHSEVGSKYSINLLYTGLIRIFEHQSFTTYLSTIRSSRRQDYKKSQKANFSITREYLLDDFLRLYELTFSRQAIKLSSSDIRFVRKLLLLLLDSGIAKMVSLVDTTGYICSSVVILSDQKCDYYLFGASDPNFRSFGVNTYLLLECIKDAFDEHKTYFDFVGINSPQRGDFKTSFNALPSPVFSLQINNKLS